MQKGMNLIQNADFRRMEGTLPQNWEQFSPRPELAPAFMVEPQKGGQSGLALGVHGYDRTQIGFWKQRCGGIEGGKTYHFSARIHTEKVAQVRESLWLKIEWCDSAREGIAKDIVLGLRRVEGGILAEDAFPAPHNATSALLEIGLQHSTGTLWFSDPHLAVSTPLPPRKVRVSTVCYLPPAHSTPEQNIAFYAEKIDEAGEAKADIVCLGETINSAFSTQTAIEAAETLPGRSTQILGAAAKRNNLWVVTSLNERVGNRVYNTAVLIDRTGKLVGKYRKTHLPESEVLTGVTPGDEYPVFVTDFGTVGMQICYDNFFPEVARSLALQGAEIIFTPIWGDARQEGYTWDIVARTRAIDNAVHFVASSFTPTRRSLIIDPFGHILADTKGKEGIVTAEIEIGQRRLEPWLSVRSSAEWRRLFPGERRPETYQKLTKSHLI
jgi:predicted amidohydrolase